MAVRSTVSIPSPSDRLLNELVLGAWSTERRTLARGLADRDAVWSEIEGAAQAINRLRWQLLVEIEHGRGIVPLRLEMVGVAERLSEAAAVLSAHISTRR